jgi:hypothetical protein
MNILLRKRIYISVRTTAFVLVIVTVVNEAALLCNERDPERIWKGSHGKDPHTTRR